MATMTIIHGSDFYILHENGQVERPGLVKPSNSWVITGAWRLNNFGQRVEFAGLADIFAGKVKDWQHKNGKQKWHVMDIDHGTTRMWMSPTHSIK